VPIITIVTSVRHYTKAAANGLDAKTAFTEGAYDIALRGGGLAAGATIGAHALGTFMPIVGHIVGAGVGMLGGWIGAEINKSRQEQPLRNADLDFRIKLAEVGGTMRTSSWMTYAREDQQVVDDLRAALDALTREWQASSTWWRRQWPTFLDVAVAESVRRGHEDLMIEAQRSGEFRELARRMVQDDLGPAHLAAVAMARPKMRRELGLTDERYEIVSEALGKVTLERNKLASIRG
jgi:hypothetical protein